MVTLARRAERIPFAPAVATMFGTVAIVLTAAVPQWMFERTVVASGLPTFVSAAAPPLGVIARLMAIVAAFGATFGVTWLAARPLARWIDTRARRRTPWHDAGYDVPAASETSAPRRPIFAPDELGAPLMSDEAIALLQAEPDPVYATAPEPLTSPAVESSIAALIQRLEKGLARRAEIDRDPDGGTPLALPSAWILSEEAPAAPRVEFNNDDGAPSSLWLPRKSAIG